MCKTRKNIVIIGSGKVASALSKAFSEKEELKLLQLVSRNRETGNALAKERKCGYTSSFEEIVPADYYIIAVSDNAVKEVSQAIAPYIRNGIVCHTSGSVPLDILDNRIQKRGVFYPLQSFSQGVTVDFQKVPLLIEGNTPESEAKLHELARIISPHVSSVTSEKREKVHLAAVFINNFTNHLFTLGSRIMEEAHLPFGYLKPLLQNTFEKITQNESSPETLQTGPAARNDMETIERHRRLLQEYPDLLKVYDAMTDSIIQNRQPYKTK